MKIRDTDKSKDVCPYCNVALYWLNYKPDNTILQCITCHKHFKLIVREPQNISEALYHGINVYELEEVTYED